MVVTTETSADASAIRPFKIEIPDAEIETPRAWIAATSWPELETVADQSQGVQLATIQAPRTTAPPFRSTTPTIGIGHNVPQEAPEAFAAAILEVGGAR
jgi:hypothetical protein